MGKKEKCRKKDLRLKKFKKSNKNDKKKWDLMTITSPPWVLGLLIDISIGLAEGGQTFENAHSYL